MGKVTELGLAREDDSIFNGSWMVFSVHKSTDSTKSGKEEKPANPSPSEPAPEQKK